MKVRYKTLLVICVVTITLMASLYLVTQYLTFEAISQSEVGFSTSNAERIRRHLNINLNDMSKVVADWASWDDSYAFISNNNSKFVESNLVDDTFSNLNLNLIFYFNSSEQLVYGKTLNLNEDYPPVKQDLAKNDLLAHKSLFMDDPEKSMQGVISLNGKPMLIVSSPILTSTNNGPVRGTLIMGRYLDRNELEILSYSSDLHISMFDLKNSMPSDDFILAQEHLSKDMPVFTHTINETHIAGYILLEDLSSNPIAILRAEDVRTAFAQGKVSLLYTLISFSFIGVTFAIVISYLIDKQIVSRLSKLNRTVLEIEKRNPDFSGRLKVDGNDELSSLAQSINSMLTVIDNQTTSLETLVKERTAELVESRERIASILQASPDVIIALDSNLNLVDFNEQFTILCKLRREELVGSSLLSFIAVKDLLRVYESITQLNAERNVISRLDCFMIRNDGSEFPIELSNSILVDAQQSIIGYVSIIRDLTQRKLLEERLLNSERLAGIGELAGMIGHDLRNPLAGIKNATYYLRKKQGSFVGDSGIQMLGIIDKAVDYSNKIINDLLDYSREIRLDLEVCSPKSLIDYVLLTLKIPSNVKVLDHTKCSPTVLADSNKIERVFTNIIKNAFDAMSEGGGTLEINSNQIGDTVELTFTDTGGGMTKEVKEKIFVPLFTTKAQGMGFGLAICKRIIDAHSGTISVRSEVGKGTTFIISLPIKEEINTFQKGENTC